MEEYTKDGLRTNKGHLSCAYNYNVSKNTSHLDIHSYTLYFNDIPKIMLFLTFEAMLDPMELGISTDMDQMN